MRALLVLVLTLFVFASKVHFEVEQKLAKSGSANIFIEFKERLNFEQLAQAKGNFDDMEENYRGILIMKSLQEVAEKSQKNVIEYLKSQNIPFEAFWIDNKIAVFSAKSAAIQALENFAEVSEIAPIVETQLDEQFGTPANITTEPNQVEIGVEWVKAPKVWALGVKGKGVVQGTSDTGAFLHPDLKDSYRGKDSGNDYNWFDAIGGRAAPYDDHSHVISIFLNSREHIAPELKMLDHPQQKLELLLNPNGFPANG